MTIPCSVNFSMITSAQCLKSSTGKLSIPDALLFSNVLIESLSSSRVISLRTMLELFITIDVILICEVEERVRI